MKIKNYKYIIFKFFFVICIFYWILKQINIDEIIEKFSDISIFSLFIVIILILINRIITSIKWEMILKHHGADHGFLKVLKIVIKSQFLGLVFPTSLGVDAVRFFQIKKEGTNFKTSAGSIIADRMLAVFVISTIPFFAVFFIKDIINDSYILYSIFLISSVLIILILLLLTDFPIKIFSFLLKHAISKTKNTRTISEFLSKLKNKTIEIHLSLKDLCKSKVLITNLLFLNFLVQFNRILQVHFLFQSININVPLTIECAFVPIIIILVLLPISFLGLGVRDGAFIFFFSKIGIPASASLSASFLSHLTKLLIIIISALIFIFDREKNHKLATESTEKND